MSVFDEQQVAEYPTLNRPPVFTHETLNWVPWIKPIEKRDLTEEQRASLVEVERANSPYFRLLARDPDALHARTLTDNDIFFNTNDGTSRADRELSAAATSRFNGCIFCASVHAARAINESSPHRTEEVEQLLAEGTSTQLTDPAWSAIVDASVALTTTPVTFDEATVTRLRDAGFDDLDIVDIINAASFFNWANRLMLTIGEPEKIGR